MTYPVTVTFRNLAPSKAVEDHLRERAAKLGVFYDRIISCRVTVESPHRHRHKGAAYQVRIDLSLPGRDIVIDHAPRRVSAAAPDEAGAEVTLRQNHRPAKQSAHEDLYVAIRDAFNAAGRKLQDQVRRRNASAGNPAGR